MPPVGRAVLVTIALLAGPTPHWLCYSPIQRRTRVATIYILYICVWLGRKKLSCGSRFYIGNFLCCWHLLPLFFQYLHIPLLSMVCDGMHDPTWTNQLNRNRSNSLFYGITPTYYSTTDHNVLPSIFQFIVLILCSISFSWFLLTALF